MASRLRSIVSSRIPALALLVTVPAFSAVAEAAAPAADEPDSVASVPEPEGSAGTTPNENTDPSADEAAPTDAQTVPEPDASTVPEPSEPPAQTPDDVAPPTAGEPAAAPSDAPPAAEPAVDPSLLDAPEADRAPVTTRPPVAADDRSPEEEAEAIEAAYAERYRPADNPVRLNVAGRLSFANISGRDGVNGRMGGASVDVGPSWNHFGVSGTVSGYAGRVLLPPQTGAELNALVGGGLTLGLGRLALLSHGFVDLRVGYDVYYGVVNQRSDAPTILAPQAEDPRIVVEITENLVPHGPRARIDLGLLGAGNRRYFHAFGLSMGYQALVGSVRGELPVSHMLMVGISYWMG